MDIIGGLKNGIQSAVTWAFGEQDPLEAEHIARQTALKNLIAYYNGVQRKPLRISGLGKNYNVITNHMRTIVDRSVSMLVGAGVEFDLPGEGDTPQKQLITLVFDANKKDLFLHDLVQFGSIYGTPAIKIIPQGVAALTGELTYRLVALNPYNLSIFTAPDDIAKVSAYVFRWNDGDTAWREITSRGMTNPDGTPSAVLGWTIETQMNNKSTGGKWKSTNAETWQYDFPPIAHGKNLPMAGSVYGYSDIEGIIELQDKYNETRSNVNKILGLQAWATLFVTGGKFPRSKDADGHEYIDLSPDRAMEFPDKDAKVGLLQPSGDLASSNAFAADTKADMFEIAATVDAKSVADKIGGGLTNFGLRVLFKNELAKNATKQLLYGDLLLTVINRLLQLEGYTGKDADPGEVKFGDALPVNKTETIDNLVKEHDLGTVSIETASKELNREYEEEKKRMDGEKQASDSLGGDMLRRFMAGNKNIVNQLPAGKEQVNQVPEQAVNAGK